MMEKIAYESPKLEVVEVWGAVKTDDGTAVGAADPADNVVSASNLF